MSLLLKKYIQLDTLEEAQFFMAGGEWPSEIFHDPDKNVWFVSEEDYNKADKGGQPDE